MYYIDTSVLAAFYLPEPLSRKVQKLYDGFDEATISVLTEVEFCSALSRRVRTKEMSRDDAKEVASLLTVHLTDRLYKMASLGEREYALARDWLGMFATPLRTLDALHLAVAFANSFVLLTADKGLAASAKHFGVKVELVS